MPALADKIRTEYDGARDRAGKAWEKFEGLRAKALEEGVPLSDLSDGSDAFKTLDDAHKEYRTEAQTAETLRDRLEKALTMDGEHAGDLKAHPMGGERQAAQVERKTAGDLVVESEAFKALRDSGDLSSHNIRVHTKAIEALGRDAFKALVTGADDTLGGALFRDDRQGGIVELPRRPRVLAGLVTPGTTDVDAVEYVRVNSRTNAAVETPEATAVDDDVALAPESGFDFEIVTENVREIPHYIPATRRALADAGQLRTIIDGELRDGVLERLDGQIANGGGTGENLQGILNVSGINAQALGADSRSDAVHKAITKIVLDFYMPDWIAMHPTDWESVRLEKDDNGNYIYGPPSQPGPMTMWGLPVIPTQAIPQGNPLVGTRRGATLWVRSGVTVMATDSHSDWFLRRLIAVMATMRVAFGVTRPAAFAEVTDF